MLILILKVWGRLIHGGEEERRSDLWGGGGWGVGQVAGPTTLENGHRYNVENSYLTYQRCTCMLSQIKHKRCVCVCQLSCGRRRWKASDDLMCTSCSEYTHNVTIAQFCTRIRQCNLTSPDKIGRLHCAEFIETEPFTGNEAVVQSNWCRFIIWASYCVRASTAVVIAIYNLPSRLIHRSPNLTKFLLRGQQIGLYVDQFLHKYIQYNTNKQALKQSRE